MKQKLKTAKKIAKVGNVQFHFWLGLKMSPILELSVIFKIKNFLISYLFIF